MIDPAVVSNQPHPSTPFPFVSISMVVSSIYYSTQIFGGKNALFNLTQIFGGKNGTFKFDADFWREEWDF